MAIQFKRKVTTGAPSVGDLLQGEIAINFADQLIYTKDDTNTIITLGGGGSGAVDSVNGATGVVVLDTDDINEGSTNFYYTSGRFDTSFSTKTTSNLSEGTNLYWTTARGDAVFDAKLSTSTTTDLAEGTNLYYTDGRVQSYVSGTMINDSVSSTTGLYSSSKIDAIVAGALNYKGAYDATANTPDLTTGAPTGTLNDFYKVSVAGSQDINGTGAITLNVGDDIIFNGTTWDVFQSTNAVNSVNTKTGTVVLDTDDIGEGSTNLYYTDARALSAVSVAGYGIINDAGTSLTEVWSANRLNTLLADVTEIDDGATTASTTKTWSINKINANYMPINVDYGLYA